MGRPKKETPNRADGLYEVKVTIGKDFTGKLIRKSFYSSISKADARAKAEEYKINKAISEVTGNVNITSARTFENWANKWLETYKKGVVKDHTYNFTYKSNLEKYLIPYFGKAHISEIQQIDIQKYFNTVRTEDGKPLAKSTLEKHKLILKSMFDAAIDNDLCIRNPVKNIKFQHVSDTAVKNVWTKEQAEIAEEFARRQWRLDIVMYLNTGLRRSELLGLKWTDIDFEENTLHVQRAVVQTKGKIVVDRPKSATSDRIVPFSAEFGKYLKKFLSDNEYVIGTDGITSPSTYAKQFSKFMEKLNAATGVPILTPHELRHTYGTIKRAEGVDIYTIQKVMGHADISITAGIYVHNDIDVLKKQLKV